jgi:hypothetical protein
MQQGSTRIFRFKFFYQSQMLIKDLVYSIYYDLHHCKYGNLLVLSHEHHMSVLWVLLELTVCIWASHPGIAKIKETLKQI